MQQEIQPQLRPTVDIQTGNIEFSVVIPVFNEESNITELFQQLTEALAFVNRNFEIIFVNDGSTDNSWSVIEKISEQIKPVRGICLTRNFGQDNAIMSGLSFSSGDYVVIMDDDLQHSPYDVPTLIDEILKGYNANT